VGGALYLGAGHTPLVRAVHEGGDGEAAGALLVPLAEELLLQLVGPPLVCARSRRQVPNVSTLQHHLHACNMASGHCTLLVGVFRHRKKMSAHFSTICMHATACKCQESKAMRSRIFSEHRWNTSNTQITPYGPIDMTCRRLQKSV